MSIHIGPVILRAVDLDRDLGHRHVLSAFGRTASRTARQDFGVLWRLDRDTRAITVRSPGLPPHHRNLGEPLSISGVAESGHLRITVAMNCQKTPPNNVSPELHAALKACPKPTGGRAYRSRMIIVPEADRPDWVTRRLERAGFAVDPGSLQIGKQLSIDLGRRRGRVPYIDVTAAGTVIDQERFSSHLANGIGKAKNYGLGLILTSAI